MKQILKYQIEQKRILDSIKLPINRKLELSDLIQAAIEQIRSFLDLDRLVIYQLNIPQENIHDCREYKMVNRVTYEVVSSKKINSILNFQQVSCQKADRYWAKYCQGFTLAINDIDRANLAPDLYHLMNQLQVKAKVVVPINVRGKLWGLLIAHQCHSMRRWNYRETQMLRQIVEYLGIVVHQDRYYEELKNQKKLLEKKVQNQAQQIENALLAAKVASQSKHEFIGNISHELKTPLTKVIGLSSTLLHWSSKEDRIPLPIEKQQQYLRTIQDSGKHLLKLINNILEVSEVQSGKQFLKIENISLFKLCQKIVESLRIKANNLALDLILDYQLESEADSFSGDKTKLQEILLNLLDNALKFTPAGGKINLRVWQENKQIILEVEDTGIGIAQRQLPLLFESFQHLDNFRQRVHDGGGISLVLTKHLVELHGGNIEVESSLGKGSIFRVCLPIKSQDNFNNHNSADAREKTPLQNKVVLITEDREIATSICQLLTVANKEIIWQTNATTAMEQFDFGEPQTVILDQDNLELEIPDLTDLIKTIEKNQNTRAILLYSQMESHEWEYLLENGMCDRLLKSTNLVKLIDKIEKS
jgi:two-component system sensor histidine kinase/response regulator